MNTGPSIQARLDALERRSRRLLAWSLTSTAGLAAACLSAASAPAPRTLRAQEFVLVDGEGRALGTWASANGLAGLHMASSDGNLTLVLGLGSETITRGVTAFDLSLPEENPREHTDSFTPTGEHSEPFAGLVVVASDEAGPGTRVLRVGTGSLGTASAGVSIETGDDAVVLGLGKGGGLLSLTGNDADSFGTLRAYALGGVAGLSLDADDRHSVGLFADASRAGLQAWILPSEGGEDPQARVEAMVDAEHDGRLLVTRKGTETFRAP